MSMKKGKEFFLEGWGRPSEETVEFGLLSMNNISPGGEVEIGV